VSPEVATKHTVARVVRFWGREYTVTPELLPDTVKFGTGGNPLLIAVQPLNTRPNYYLVLLDTHSGFDFHEDDLDVDDILIALEEHYGSTDDEDLDDEWPRVNLDSGYVMWIADEEDQAND
jgi:hypothetical protein